MDIDLTPENIRFLNLIGQPVDGSPVPVTPPAQSADAPASATPATDSEESTHGNTATA